MGLFGEYRDHRALQTIRSNGLPDGTGGDVCEHCRYRMADPKSNFLVCAVHKFHVGADQVCSNYSFGSPMYELK